MKAALALFMSLVMFVGGLMPHNDVEELGKLPQLLAHFQHHHRPHGGAMSVGQFLNAHYGANSSVVRQCPPSAEHDNLPLHGQHRMPNLEYVIPAARLLVQGHLPAWPSTTYALASAPRYRNADSPALLQPPRA